MSDQKQLHRDTIWLVRAFACPACHSFTPFEADRCGGCGAVVGLHLPTRSMLTLALMVALGREEEFKLHVRPALRNGVTLPELRALLIQCAVYAGVPAANGAFRWVRDMLGDELDRR